MIQIKVEQARIDQKQTALLVIGVYENESDFNYSNSLDSSLSNTILEILSNKEFIPVLGARLIIPTMNKGPMKKIMLIGLGEKEKFNNEKARIASAKAALKIRE